MKLAVYFAVVKNFKHVTATCSKATLLTQESLQSSQMQSRSPLLLSPAPSLREGFSHSLFDPNPITVSHAAPPHTLAGSGARCHGQQPPNTQQHKNMPLCVCVSV